MNDLIAKLNKAVKPKGGDTPTGSFRHENEEAIIKAATDLLAKSETGQHLLNFASDNNVAMHVLRHKQDYGFMPDASAVYITCPAGQDMPSARAVLHLASALRQAMHESEDNLKRPEAQVGRERFLQIHFKKDTDIALWVTEIGYQLHQATGLSQIIDELGALGYDEVYEAYKLDLKEAEASGNKG